MSKYTTEVRFICESYAGLVDSADYASVDEVLDKAAPKVFSFNFPMFDEAYRATLEKKILKHYYTREISFETVGLWKLKLDTKMNEIMPYYNQLYKSTTLEFNPLYDFEITRTHELKKNETGNNTSEVSSTGTTTDNGNSTQTDNNTAKRTNAYSDTPQGGLTNVENGTYLTTGEVDKTQVENTTGITSENTRTSNAESDSKANSKIDTTEEYLEKVGGKQGSGSYAKLLEEYRKTFLNIDMQVIEELSDLFMGLW